MRPILFKIPLLMIGADLAIQGARGFREGQSYKLTHFRMVFKPGGAAIMTPDTAQSDYVAIPDGTVLFDAWGKIKTTFSGNAISALTLGDSGDADRWGVASALTRNATFYGSPGAFAPIRVASYAPRLTGDQIATAGEAIVFYTGFVPSFTFDFNYPA